MGEIKVVKIPRVNPLEVDIQFTPKVNININTSGPSAEEIINRFLSGEITAEEYQKLLSEVIIRFNTEPRKYEKSDYRKLIQAIIGLKKLLEKRISECEDRISECEERLDDHDNTLQDHEDRIIEVENKVSTLETIDIQSLNTESLLISKDGVTFKLNPILLSEITEVEQITDNKKTASVTSIRNYITNQLTWIEK